MGPRLIQHEDGTATIQEELGRIHVVHDVDGHLYFLSLSEEPSSVCKRPIIQFDLVRMFGGHSRPMTVGHYYWDSRNPPESINAYFDKWADSLHKILVYAKAHQDLVNDVGGFRSYCLHRVTDDLWKACVG